MEGRANKLASGADGRTSGAAVWVGSVGGGGGGGGRGRRPERKGLSEGARCPPSGEARSETCQWARAKAAPLVSARSPVTFSFSCLGLKEREDWDRVRAGLLFLQRRLLPSGRIWCFKTGLSVFRRWKLRFTLASFPSISICLLV